MNTEILSPVPSMSSPSFGGRIDGGLPTVNIPLQTVNVGGMHNPDLNDSNMFSLPELKVDSIDTFNKVVPGNLALTHTEIQFQASEKPTTEHNSMFDDSIMQRGNLDTGRVNRPDLNSNIFSQTEILWQARAKPVTETKSMIEYPQVDIIELAKIDFPTVQTLEKTLDHLKSIDFVPTKNPEPTISEDAGRILDSYVTRILEQAPEETRVIGNKMHPLESNQEIRADAEQAAKVKEAWMAIGTPEKEAERSAVGALKVKFERTGIAENLEKQQTHNVCDAIQGGNPASEQIKQIDSVTDSMLVIETEESTASIIKTQEKQEFLLEATIIEVKKEDVSNSQQEEIFFEEDTNADKAREEIAKKAIEVVSEKVSKAKNREINGAEIAEEMPSNPQPNEARSEIIKESKKHDGSYVEMTKQIAGSGKIETPDNGRQIIEKAIKENPAVRITSVKTSRSVTKEDVEKVLGEEVLLFTSHYK